MLLQKLKERARKEGLLGKGGGKDGQLRIISMEDMKAIYSNKNFKNPKKSILILLNVK